MGCLFTNTQRESETRLSANTSKPWKLFPPGLSESETIDDITSVVHFRFVEPTKINSFPLSGPAGSPVCQWAVTIAVQGWAWPVNCCWQEENMLTGTGTSQNTDLHFSLPSKETQSRAIFKTQGTLPGRSWGRAELPCLGFIAPCRIACPGSSRLCLAETVQRWLCK